MTGQHNQMNNIQDVRVVVTPSPSAPNVIPVGGGGSNGVRLPVQQPTTLMPFQQQQQLLQQHQQQQFQQQQSKAVIFGYQAIKCLGGLNLQLGRYSFLKTTKVSTVMVHTYFIDTVSTATRYIQLQKQPQFQQQLQF
jgi:hypothetical protein